MAGAAHIINDGQVEHVALDRLRPHPQNPREGDVGAVWESIQQNGFYGAIVVQRSTGYILAGNHRLYAAKEAGMSELPVIYVDVSDEEALRILLADNRTSDLAGYDGETLADLLEHLATTDDALTGTGYDGDALDELLHDLERDWQDGEGGPGEQAKSSTAIRPVITVEDTQTVEMAFQLTGKINRAEAFLAICRGYIRHGD